MILTADAIDLSKFFTPTSVFTFTGISAATFLIPNVLRYIWGWNPKWLGLAIAEALCLIGTVLYSGNVAAYFAAVVNGFLVFFTAAGATTAAASVGGGQPRSFAANKTPRRRWFIAWFGEGAPRAAAAGHH